MAKVKIPLEVANGVMARNIEELKENFDIKKVVGYFLDGKLHKWLEDRYYDDELEAIGTLSATDECLADKLCEVFNVVQDTSSIVVEDISKSNEKLGLIREITDDDKLIDQSERMARNQEELDQLVSAGERKIYLLEGTFEINLKYENVKYIGIKDVVAKIPSKEAVPFGKKNIKFKNIIFDEEYKKIEKFRMINNRFIIVRDKILFSDEQGKLNFVTFEARTFKAFYENEQSEVLREILPDGRKKRTVQKFFAENVNTPIISLCGSEDMYGAIDESGQVYTWGIDEKVKVIESVKDVAQIECGLNKYFAIDVQGNLYLWGKDEFKPSPNSNIPLLKQLAVNSGIALGLTIDGHVVKIDSCTDDSRMNIPKNLPNIKKISVGKDAVYALTNSGQVYAWGNKYSCQMPKELGNIVDIGTPDDCTPVIDENGNIILCGRKDVIRAFEPRLKNMPKVKSVLRETYDYIWFISMDNEVYSNNRKMKIRRRNQEETFIKIYDNN